jgi:hypothetical protein
MQALVLRDVKSAGACLCGGGQRDCCADEANDAEGSQCEAVQSLMSVQKSHGAVSKDGRLSCLDRMVFVS